MYRQAKPGVEADRHAWRQMQAGRGEKIGKDKLGKKGRQGGVQRQAWRQMQAGRTAKTGKERRGSTSS